MSNTMTHTPGPWRVDPAFTDQVLERGDDLICETGGNAANARLIAAAPETAAERDKLLAINADLLAALEALTCELSFLAGKQRHPATDNDQPIAPWESTHPQSAWQMARAAIAAARGE